MGHVAGLKLAIDLLHFPSRVRSLRSAALPDDVSNVVRIAAGDRQAIEAASARTGRSREVVREAAAFFVEQILLYPGADSYRVLGARPDATRDELRRNMVTLMRWLHPDQGRHGERAVFASRVNVAWGHVKTADRRAAYNRLIRSEVDKAPSRQGGSGQSQKRSANEHSPYGRRQSRHVSGRFRHQPLDAITDYKDESLVRRILMLLLGRFVP
jgi:hypothetical protein